MVEDHVSAVGYTCSILTAVATLSHTEAHVAHDDVACSRKRDSIAINHHTFARSSLACHIKIFGKYNTTADFDNSRHIKNYDAVWLAYGISKRAFTRVVEVSYMLNATRASACGKASEALSFRESQLLCLRT